jgi:hypothetical protein
MDVLPPGQQRRLRLGNNPHGATNLAAGHAIGPDQLRRSARASQVDLGLTVTEYVDVGRVVIVNEDDHTQAFGAQNSDHQTPYPIMLGYASGTLHAAGHVQARVPPLLFEQG